MSLFSPPTDRLHVITPTGAPVSPMGTDNLAAYRDTHDTLIHSERLLNLLHTHTRTRARQVLPYYPHTHSQIDAVQE